MGENKKSLEEIAKEERKYKEQARGYSYSWSEWISKASGLW